MRRIGCSVPDTCDHKPSVCGYAIAMAYFVLFYETVDNFFERRVPHRQAHLALVDEACRDRSLVLAGALKPDGGALLLFRSEDAAAAESFARRDPYVTNGLVTAWRVREWAVVVGEDAIPRQETV
jgi:uncharacterized protein YciI